VNQKQPSWKIHYREPAPKHLCAQAFSNLWTLAAVFTPIDRILWKESWRRLNCKFGCLSMITNTFTAPTETALIHSLSLAKSEQFPAQQHNPKNRFQPAELKPINSPKRKNHCFLLLCKDIDSRQHWQTVKASSPTFNCDRQQCFKG